MRRRESRRLGRPVVGDDPGLRVLLTDLADARLTPIGRVWLRNELIRRDVTEAGLHDELRHRPDVLDTLVPRPLVVVGLPRTGTTLLHALLGCDPAAFVLPFWQQLRRPYPVPRGRLDRATRIVRAPAMASLARSMAPRLRDIHPVSSLRPEEDVFLLRDTGMLAVPVAAPGYLRWLQATRPRNTGPTAGTCRRCYAIGPDAAGAEVIVSSGSTWALLGEVPEAMAVWTHRDPAVALASWCSLAAVLASASSHHVDLVALGRRWLDFWPARWIGPGRQDRRRSSPLSRRGLRGTGGDPLREVERVYAGWAWSCRAPPGSV